MTQSITFYTIPPPPERDYPSHDGSEVALHAWTREHGLNISRCRVRYVNKTHKVIWARIYECDQAGSSKCTQKLGDKERERIM
jgi:hypothetical protein